MYSKTYSDEIYENKAGFIWVKNKKPLLFYRLFSCCCKFLSQNGLQMIHLDNLIRLHLVYNYIFCHHIAIGKIPIIHKQHCVMLLKYFISICC